MNKNDIIKNLDKVDEKIKINLDEKIVLYKEKKSNERELQNILLKEAKEKGFDIDVEVEFFRESIGMKKPFKTSIHFLFIDSSNKDERFLRAVLNKLPNESHGMFFVNPTLEELTIV